MIGFLERSLGCWEGWTVESRREPRGSGSVVGQGDGGLDSGRGGSGEKWADWGCPGSEALERSRADGVLSVRSCWGASTDTASQVAVPEQAMRRPVGARQQLRLLEVRAAAACTLRPAGGGSPALCAPLGLSLPHQLFRFSELLPWGSRKPGWFLFRNQPPAWLHWYNALCPLAGNPGQLRAAAMASCDPRSQGLPVECLSARAL